MTISKKEWSNFVESLSKLSAKAADDLKKWVETRGGYLSIPRSDLIRFVYSLATKYGEGTAALSATWYDAVASLSGKVLPAAEVASTATYAEVAEAVNGVLDRSKNLETLAGAVERLVKLPGVDTTLNNAIRDGAEYAWIPSGDTCAFCIALASAGWQKASKKSLSKGHASHIHANCNCNYEVRFDNATEVAGYDYREYREMYDNAGGNNSTERINSLRRKAYEENSEAINAQKRIAYQKRRELEKTAEEKNV